MFVRPGCKLYKTDLFFQDIWKEIYPSYGHKIVYNSFYFLYMFNSFYHLHIILDQLII